MRTTLNCVALLLTVGLGVQASAQRTEGSVSIVGGSATDVVGLRSRAITVLPSLGVTPDPRLAFGLYAAGTKYDNDAWSLGGGATTAARVPLHRRVALTLDADVATTGTSYDFSYTTASALPTLEITAGAVTAFAGARGAYATTHASRSVQLPGGLFSDPVVQRSMVSASRAARAGVYGLSARLTSAAGETMVLGAREERGVVDTMPTVDRVASMSVLSGRVTLGGTAGIRSERSATSTYGNGSLSIAMTPVVALELAAGAYPSNRLVGTSSGRFVNVGLSLRSGRATSAKHAPKAEGVPAPPAGVTRLTLRDPDARRVDIAGDFTNWKPLAATRARNDVWFIDLRIPAGQYRYAFRVDGAAWKVPDGVEVVADDFGGKAAWLTVSGSPDRPAR